MDDPRPVLMSPVLMAQWATRDTEGNLIRWEWRAPDDGGYWEPTVTVDRSDNIIATERARIRAVVEELPGADHNGDGCDCHVERAAVIAALDPD